jgi:hypothetical protein
MLLGIDILVVLHDLTGHDFFFLDDFEIRPDVVADHRHRLVAIVVRPVVRPIRNPNDAVGRIPRDVSRRPRTADAQPGERHGHDELPRIHDAPPPAR